MGLFDKKFCDFCGEKLGLFGHTTLSDGRICKACAAKLSPWWSIGKKTSMADVHEHLYYREDNKAKVAEFRVTRSLGDVTKVLVDDDARRVMITSASDLAKANPDVFEFADITSARLDIEDSKYEIHDKDKDGKTISFDPKRYEYRYNFYVTAYVKNPYFDTIRFKVNSSYVSISPYEEYEAKQAEYRELQMKHLGARPVTGDPYTPNIEENEDYQAYKAVGEEIVAVLNER